MLDRLTAEADRAAASAAVDPSPENWARVDADPWATPGELDIAAWAAASQQQSGTAVRLLQRAVAIDPENWLRLRSLSGQLAALGDYDAARVVAEQAYALAPADAWEPAYHYGAVLNLAKAHSEAIAPLLRAAQLNRSEADIFHQLAWAAQNLDRLELAATLAQRAQRLDPTSLARVDYAGYLLNVLGRKTEAVSLLRLAVEDGFGAPATRRALAALLHETGDLKGAVAQLDAALELEPDNGELRLYLSSLLYEMGQFERAAAECETALRASPDSLHAMRHAVTLYLEAGRVSSAIAVAARLLNLAPEEPEYASCMRHVLSARERSAAARPVSLLARKRGPGRRKAPPRRSLADAAATQGRVILALLLREMRTRFGESRLGYLWALIEVAIHLGVLALVFPFTMHGKPPIGDSFFFFYFTGLVPYLLFIHVVGQLNHAIEQNRPMLQLPQVTIVDVIIARALLELVTIVGVALVFIAGFLLFGVDAIPHDPGAVASALGAVWMFAIGVGIFNGAMKVFTHAWDHFFSIVIRLLYFTSGIFYVPAMMPEWLRDGLMWNPLLCAVDWFRTGFFPHYQPYWLDRGYPVAAGMFALLIGLMVERAMRRVLMLPR